MKKITLIIALTATALPLVAQNSSSPYGEEMAERNARKARLAAQAAEQQAVNNDGVYRGTVFGAQQQTYTGNTLGNPQTNTAKTKYVYDTSLIRAIKLNDEDRVRTLIYANVDVNERNYANITPLTLAAEKGNLNIV